MLSIREKIAGNVAMLVLLACGIGAIALGRFDSMATVTRDLSTQWLPSVQVLGNITLFAQRHRALVTLHVLNTDEGRKAQIDREIADDLRSVENARGRYQALIATPEQQAAYDTFRHQWTSYLKVAEEVLVLSRRNENAAAAQLLQDRAWPTFTQSRLTLDRLIELNAKGSEAAAATGARTEAEGRTLILAILGGGLLVGLGLGGWIVIGVGRDIGGLSAPMERLARGDLAVAIPSLPARTEMGRMSAALGTLAQGLRQAEAARAAQEETKRQAEAERKASLLKVAETLERQVGTVVNGITSASTELASAAASMVEIAATTTQRAATVSSASGTADADVGAVAAATEELATSVTEISRQVAESARMAASAVEQSTRTDATVTNLTEAAAKIGEVTRLIGAIAGQTNLLALNATIEAARAGDAGRGFAVVASEVKTLANETARATENIAAQIAAMQAATRDAAQDLGNIRDSIGRISEVTAAIAAAVEEQGAATKDIAHSVQSAASGTREIATAMQGVTEAARETGGAASQVKATAGDLSSQAETLHREVRDVLADIRAA